VILLLVFVLYWAPSTSGNREREVQKDCQTHLQKIYVAMEIYANEHAGGFPVLTGAVTSAEALDALVPRYTVDTAVFVCPGSKDRPLSAGESFRQHKISYAYYMGRGLTNAPQVLLSDAQVDSRAKAAGQQVFSSTGKPPGSNHGKAGGNFLFTDGHAEMSAAYAPFALSLGGNEVLLNP